MGFQLLHSNALQLPHADNCCCYHTTPQRWVAFQLLHGLAQAHEAGVCHGDLKVRSWRVLEQIDALIENGCYSTCSLKQTCKRAGMHCFMMVACLLLPLTWSRLFVCCPQTENVLLTSWHWLFIADWAPYKPTFLPRDNPVRTAAVQPTSSNCFSDSNCGQLPCAVWCHHKSSCPSKSTAKRVHFPILYSLNTESSRMLSCCLAG